MDIQLISPCSQQIFCVLQQEEEIFAALLEGVPVKRQANTVHLNGVRSFLMFLITSVLFQHV